MWYDEWPAAMLGKRSLSGDMVSHPTSHYVLQLGPCVTELEQTGDSRPQCILWGCEGAPFL